jgi:hypothetical protein
MELENHCMKPEDFDDIMAHAKRHKPEASSGTTHKNKTIENKRERKKN